MDAGATMEAVRRLCSFEGRLAGTDAERRAANDLARALDEDGLEVEVEPTYVHPQAPLVHAAHCAAGVAGSLLTLAQPAVGFAIGLAAAISMYLDLNARLYLLRRLFFRRASQNVVARDNGEEARARLILCAHYDAGRSGYALRPGSVRVAAAVQSALRAPIGPYRLLFSALFLQLPLVGARLAGLEGTWLSALQIVPVVVLIVGAFLLVDVQLSAASPGANANASGVATALAVSRELRANPAQGLEVWTVLTGAGAPGMEGMREFVRRHRDELEPERTFFLCLDAVGRGPVRYVTAEGPAVSFAMDRRLTELCEAIASAGGEGDEDRRAEPLRHGFGTDAFVARAAGYRAIALRCLEPGLILPPGYRTPADVPETLDAKALARAGEFALELVRQLDREAERRFKDPQPSR